MRRICEADDLKVKYEDEDGDEKKREEAAVIVIEVDDDEGVIRGNNKSLVDVISSSPMIMKTPANNRRVNIVTFSEVFGLLIVCYVIFLGFCCMYVG